ncbi:hypothetical protein [Tepidibacter sp. Z1-5]|uniref:hypothetical protein n=1 Tax=Tepidibacter sp. Z1-5 TaxID=3134138 RepID=UPI0030C01D80
MINYKNILFEYINKNLIKFREISLNGNGIGEKDISVKLYYELKYKNSVLFEQGRDYLLYTIKDKKLDNWNYNIFSVKYNLNMDNKIVDCITIVFNKNNNLNIDNILNISQKFLPKDSIVISRINKEYIKFDLNDKGEKIKYNIKYESKKVRKNTGKSNISLDIYKVVEPLLYSDEVREQFIRVKISN